MARELLRQVLFLVVRREVEGALQSMKYPGKLARLVSRDAGKRERAKAGMRTDIAAFEIWGGPRPGCGSR